MDTMWQDFRFALRTLRKNLGVTLLAIGSLALAIAGNTAVYSMVASFLYRPIPYPDVEQLVLVGEYSDEALAGQVSSISPANYLDLAERQRSFEQMAAFRGGAYSLDDGGDQPTQMTVGLVTPDFFELVGADMAWGRRFTDDEAVAGRDRIALISHQLWTERFGGRRDLAGETLDLNGEVYDIVGAIGDEFEWLLSPKTDVWLPLSLQPGAEARDQRTLFAIARLAPGIAQDAADTEMTALMAQLVEEHPASNRGFQVELLNMRHDIPDARNRVFFRLLQVALIFVLLIACANIANLLLARSQARQRELAIRTSIGASRRRIVFQLFTESMVTAGIAGLLGIALGAAGLKLINNALANFLPSYWIPSLDLRVLAYSLGVTALGGILFGLAPVLQSSSFELTASLKDGNPGATSGGKRRLASNALVTLEIAFALAFLAGAGIMISTFQTMQQADPGFETADVLIMGVALPTSRYDSPELQAAAAADIATRLSSVPGAKAAVVSNATPRTPLVPREGFEIAGRPVVDEQALPRAGWLAVDDGYFAALGIRLERGRDFAASDDLSAAPVVVVNRALAERFFADIEVLGQHLTVRGKERSIIGVVETIGHDVIVRTDDNPLIYVPWAQQPSATFSLAIKAAVDPGTLSEPVRAEMSAIDRGIVVNQVQTLDAFIEQFWVGQQVFTAILGGFGILALVLAALGTYGVLAYSVAQRRHEIGIRMAIGADRRRILRMIVGQGLIFGSIGIALGLLLVPLQLKLIASIFQGLVPVEPTSVITSALILGLVTVAASAIPAFRATRVDPMNALRSD